jgi:leader peptidase (prepilin peptidase)/N-methyltransferase
LTIAIVLVSAAVGSFLGVLIERWPAGRSVVWPASSCDHCSRRLRALDLIPLLSWLAQSGRCRYCRQAIGTFYPAIELAAVLVALWALLTLRDQSPALIFISIGLGWVLLAAAWIDARVYLLPDILTLPLIPAGIAVAWWLDASPIDHLVGGLVGFVGFAGIAALYRRLRQRDGLGLGDAKLLAAAGSWLGWQALPSVVLIGAVMGLIVGTAMAVRRGTTGTDMPVPFGPALAGAFWLVWLYGPLQLSAID